jgi:phosphoribosylformylglycinamidine synthase
MTRRFDNHPPITSELCREHGLTPDEYARVLAILGREPTLTELGIFSVMWSEHCSYKSSKVHLGRFPTQGPRVLVGPGENAGVVEIGDGWAAAFKMESHNHPSFIEPYQGAATGVGGILRDIFTMGARPLASLDSLRFGSPTQPRTRHLVDGVVRGIGGYGNCIGVPTVGGEVGFDPSYNGNPLVNVMNLGLLRRDRIFKGQAHGVGNPVIYVGAKTGRDGIHGATMASDIFDETAEQRRPTVQVGDPFTGKLLLEACLELFSTDLCVGIQDMGAAGLTSSSFEMAGRAGNGLELDLDRVPARATDLTPYEMMLSESQERMLLVARQGTETEVLAIFEKWDLDVVVVGRVTDTGRVVVRSRCEVVADIPVDPIATGAPRYERPMREPADLAARQTLDLAAIPDLAPGAEASAALAALLGSVHLASRRPLFRQYDHMVGVATVLRPGEADAAVMRVPGTSRGIAMTVDCNPRLGWLDPYRGAAAAVAEACRNLACVGAEPVGLTDCLNFGNPERPEVMWELSRSIDGIADACRALEVPVVSGNVSLYNETPPTAIKPTPTIGAVGVLDDVTTAVPAALLEAGLEVALLGADAASDVEGLSGSVLLLIRFGGTAGRPPEVDFAAERAVQGACRELVRSRVARAAHDVSEGGLAVALAELCLGGPGSPAVGAILALEPGGGRLDRRLFGEAPGRILIAYPPSERERVHEVATRHRAGLTVLGTSGGDALVVSETATGVELCRADLAELARRHAGGLLEALGMEA